MSSPPDFLGMALGMMNQRRQQQSQTMDMALRAKESARDDAYRAQQMEHQREQVRQQALAQSIEALSRGATKKHAIALFETATGGDFPSSYLPLIEGEAKLRDEQKKQTEQKDATGQFGASAAGEIGQRLRSLLDARKSGGFASPGDQQGFGEALAAASRNFGGSAGPVIQAGVGEAQNIQSARQEQTLSREESDKFAARGQYRGAAISDARNFGNYLVPSGIAEQLGFRGLPMGNGLTAVTAKTTDEQRKLAQAGGVQTGSASGVSYGGESLGVTPTVESQIQTELVGLGAAKRNLEDLRDAYDPKFLKYLTRGKAEAMKQFELLGGMQTQEGEEFLAQFDKMERLRGQDAMDQTFFYLRSTFTDVATKKVEALRLSGNLTPAQFEQRLNDLTELSNREIARRHYLLKRGFLDTTDPEGLSETEKKRLDREVSIGKVGGVTYGPSGVTDITEIMANRSEELRRAARTRGMQPGEERETWVKKTLAEEFGLGD